MEIKHMIPYFVCPGCRNSITHELGNDKATCTSCGYEMLIGHFINATSRKEVEKLSEGYYWFYNWGGWEPVELEHIDGQIYLHMLGDSRPYLVPDEIKEGTFFYTPRLMLFGEQ